MCTYYEKMVFYRRHFAPKKKFFLIIQKLLKYINGKIKNYFAHFFPFFK